MHHHIHFLIRDTLVLVILGGLSPLLLSSLVGVALSTFQAMTQIQEQTLAFLVRIAVVSLFFVLFGSFITERFLTLIRSAFQCIATIG